MTATEGEEVIVTCCERIPTKRKVDIRRWPRRCLVRTPSHFPRDVFPLRAASRAPHAFKNFGYTRLYIVAHIVSLC